MSVSTEADEGTANDRLGDFFKFDLCAFSLHFPCVVCIHREKPAEEVCSKGCRYYFN